jgi:threonine/homoserine/homoserine lactone efflux protein
MVPLSFILLMALMAATSPGPATLGIANTAMQRGPKAGLAFAAGVTCGSLTWSVTAALGLGAVMLAHGWILEVVRYAGAGYLLFLGFKAARSALRPGQEAAREASQGPLSRVFFQGLLLHLTNPKAILFFGSLYALVLSPSATAGDILTVIVAVTVQSALIFHGYALMFSRGAVMRAYVRARRGFDGVFALVFGVAGLKLLTMRLTG